MEGQFSEIKISHKGIDLVLKTDNTIFVENLSVNEYQLSIYNPEAFYSGYVKTNFSPSTWISSNPSKWESGWTNNFVEVILIGSDYQFKFLVDIWNRKLQIDENDLVEIKNFQVAEVGITFITSAYKTQNYIDSLLNSIVNLKKDFINFEILVGVDACADVLKKVSETEYPEYIKFYFFPENVGNILVTNTLVKKSKYENIIIVGSDDFFHQDLLKHFLKEIKIYDVVNWSYFVFRDGEDEVSDKLEIVNEFLGCLGIKKNVFLSLNGYHPWRCHSDAEFQERILNLGIKIKYLKEPLFYYRVLRESVSRSGITKLGSTLRNTYLSIVDERRVSGKWVNPSRLYTADCIRIK